MSHPNPFAAGTGAAKSFDAMKGRVGAHDDALAEHGARLDSHDAVLGAHADQLAAHGARLDSLDGGSDTAATPEDGDGDGGSQPDDDDGDSGG